MRQWRNIFDRRDRQPNGLKRPDRGLATGTRPLDPDLDLLDPHGERFFAHHRCRLLCRVGGAFFRSLEPKTTGAGPAQNVPFEVAKRYDLIIKTGEDIRDPHLFGAHAFFTSNDLLFYHFFSVGAALITATVLRLPFLVRAFVRVRCPLTGNPILCL